MNREMIQDYTRRIANSNSSQMIVVLYDILQEYLNEGEEAIKQKNFEEMKKSLRKASETLEHLKSDLNFRYDIANQLFPLYDFCQRAIAKSMYQADVTGIAEARRVIEPLAKAWEKVAAEDTSAPMMSNTQQVTAGYTYNRTNLTESTNDLSTSRGFLA